jgi:flagellar basal body rod protein FlgG
MCRVRDPLSAKSSNSNFRGFKKTQGNFGKMVTRVKSMEEDREPTFPPNNSEFTRDKMTRCNVRQFRMASAEGGDSPIVVATTGLKR